MTRIRRADYCAASIVLLGYVKRDTKDWQPAPHVDFIGKSLFR
jgi:hypothetical protein